MSTSECKPLGPVQDDEYLVVNEAYLRYWCTGPDDLPPLSVQRVLRGSAAYRIIQETGVVPQTVLDRHNMTLADLGKWVPSGDERGVFVLAGKLRSIREELS